jgi:hypothetical protein
MNKPAIHCHFPRTEKMLGVFQARSGRQFAQRRTALRNALHETEIGYLCGRATLDSTTPRASVRRPQRAARRGQQGFLAACRPRRACLGGERGWVAKTRRTISLLGPRRACLGGEQGWAAKGGRRRASSPTSFTTETSSEGSSRETRTRLAFQPASPPRQARRGRTCRNAVSTCRVPRRITASRSPDRLRAAARGSARTGPSAARTQSSGGA